VENCLAASRGQGSEVRRVNEEWGRNNNRPQQWFKLPVFETARQYPARLPGEKNRRLLWSAY